jgi:hypothetical protein
MPFAEHPADAPEGLGYSGRARKVGAGLEGEVDGAGQGVAQRAGKP